MDRAEAVGRTAFRRDTAGMAVSHIAHVACSWTNNWLLNRQLNIGQSLSTDTYCNSQLCLHTMLHRMTYFSPEPSHAPPSHTVGTELWSVSTELLSTAACTDNTNRKFFDLSAPKLTFYRSSCYYNIFVKHGIHLRPLRGEADHTRRVTQSSNSFFGRQKIEVYKQKTCKWHLTRRKKTNNTGTSKQKQKKSNDTMKRTS